MSSSARTEYDAVVVGAGPNGLAAAITLAQAGHSVVVFEGHEVIGGGSRSKELTLPGFVHDVCSAIHPLGLASPFFRKMPLEEFGVEWIQPPAPLAHPLDDGTAVLLERTLANTEKWMGPDGAAWTKLYQPLVEHWQGVVEGSLAPLRPIWQVKHPLTSLEMLRLGFFAVQSPRWLAEHHFKGERARAIFAGMSAHSMLQLEHPMGSAAGLLLGMLAPAVGWPLPKGGSQTIVDAMAAYLRSLGGEIITG